MKKIITLIIVFLVNSTFASRAFADSPGVPPVPFNGAGLEEKRSIDTIKNREQETKLLNSLEKDKTNLPTIDSEQLKEEPTGKSDNVKVLINEVITDQSEILSKDEIESITCELKGKETTLTDINNVVHKINNLYKEKDCITARAYVPEQKLEGGVLKIDLIESRVGKIVVEGNKHTKDSYILDKISQDNGDIFKLRVLENDLIIFNTNNDIKLKARLKAGQEAGTTDIYLLTDDPNPFHIAPTFDRAGKDSIGNLRGGLAFTNDSLFGYRDRLTIGSNLARSTVLAYTDYNFPIFNKGTRIGGSFSFSRIKMTSGPFEPLKGNANSFNYSVYATHPFISKPNFNFSGNIGFNFKQGRTYFDTTACPDPTQIRSLVTGFSSQWNTEKGVWVSSHNFSNGFDLLGGNKQFFKYEGNILRVHNLGHGFTGLFKASTQLTPDKLDSFEQFQLGGISTVRGYSEGLLIGNNGYLVSTELITPLPFLPEKLYRVKPRELIKGVIFCDHGAAFPFISEDRSAHHTDYLTSVGLGLRLNISKYLGGRLNWGFGIGNRERPQPVARFHFDLQSTPF